MYLLVLLSVLFRTSIKVLTKHIACTKCYYFLIQFILFCSLYLSRVFKLSIKPLFCVLLLSGLTGFVLASAHYLFQETGPSRWKRHDSSGWIYNTRRIRWIQSWTSSGRYPTGSDVNPEENIVVNMFYYAFQGYIYK